MKKRKLVAAAALVLTLGIVIGATVAYLTDRTDPVVNTFTVGNVALKLDEALVDEYGKPGKMSDGKFDPVERIEDADRVAGNNYLLIPGQTYTKDPTTTVTNKTEEGQRVDSYVRMKVKVTGLEKLKTILPNEGITAEYYATEGDKTVFRLEKLVDGWDPDTWKTDWAWGFDQDKKTYEFRYKEIVPADDEDTKLEPLFTKFTLPWFVTEEQIKTLKNFKINVTAEAIQAATLTTEGEAWAAFDEQRKN